MDIDFSVAVDREDRRAVVTIVGELDVATAPQLLTHLEELVDPPVPEVVLDMTGTAFVDSTGLSVVVRLVRMLGDDGTVTIDGASPALRRLLELTGIAGVVGLAPAAGDVL